MAPRKSRTLHKPPTAEIGDVEEFATTIKSTWVTCRSDGHDMRPLNVTMTEQNTFVRTRKCRNCGARRHQVIDRHGLILDTKIEYPEGYLLPPGTGRLDSEGRGIFRLAALQSDLERKTAGRR
jgi:hypothetical protein